MRGTLLLIIIGLVLAVILTIKTTPTTIHYTTQYFNYLACSYKAFYTGDFKTYTTCTTNALKTIWNALEATPKILAQELGWW
jgi:hypothetical protein